MGMKFDIPKFEGKAQPMTPLNGLTQWSVYLFYESIIACQISSSKLLPRGLLEYHNSSQRNTTVEEFIAEFDMLRMKTSPLKTEISQGPPSTPKTIPARLIRCFKCQGIGHFAQDCPNQQQVTLT
uniref:CCHC-type domain-containing protein n=1 Tax=Lactuca sativa TaxID=4236 RepID=A0A9R1X073_LACSA|nr:hypothetical protein LSAT_V11C800448730 [Lactuca sativa]